MFYIHLVLQSKIPSIVVVSYPFRWRWLVMSVRKNFSTIINLAEDKQMFKLRFNLMFQSYKPTTPALGNGTFSPHRILAYLYRQPTHKGKILRNQCISQKNIKENETLSATQEIIWGFRCLQIFVTTIYKYKHRAITIQLTTTMKRDKTTIIRRKILTSRWIIHNVLPW